jgi:hypothetical protein
MGDERVNVARRYPQHVSRLWGYVRRDAGGKRLPDFR